MTPSEYRQAIFDLLKRSPKPELIAGVQQVRTFKAAADAAKKAAYSAKSSPARLQTTLNELRMFYDAV
jgi:hypothetical protein